MNLNIKILNNNAKIPTYGSEFSAGADLYCAEDKSITVDKGSSYLFHTGIAMEIPVGYVGLIFARSGLATKRGLAPSNKVGVIDSDYRGEIMVSLYNQSNEPQTVDPGERIAQICIVPFIQCDFNTVDELSDTNRGSGGFGSTGTK